MLQRRISLLMFAATTSASLCLCAPARAEPSATDRETARQLMKEGRRLEKEGDLPGALAAYQRARELVKAPTTGLAAARMLSSAGKLVEARDAALEVVHMARPEGEPAVFDEARTEAAALAAELGPRIPTLTLTITGLLPTVTASVRVDDAKPYASHPPTPRAMNPGTHRIVVEAAGYSTATFDVKVAAGDKREMSVQLNPAPQQPQPAAQVTPPPSPAPQTYAPPALPPLAPQAEKPASGGTPWLAWTGFGLAAAGLATGIGTGLASANKTQAIKDECTGNRCPARLQDEADAARRWALASDIGFGVAIVGIGIGIYGLVSPSRPASRISAAVGPGSVSVAGVF